MSKIIRSYVATTAVAHRQIVKFGANDGEVVPATAGTGIGVVDNPGGAQAGQRVDVVRFGLAEVTFAGSVTRGGPITANADGAAVASAPASGVNGLIVGWAEVSASAADIALAFVNPGQIQGA